MKTSQSLLDVILWLNLAYAFNIKLHLFIIPVNITRQITCFNYVNYRNNFFKPACRQCKQRLHVLSWILKSDLYFKTWFSCYIPLFAFRHIPLLKWVVFRFHVSIKNISLLVNQKYKHIVMALPRHFHASCTVYLWDI